MYDPFVSVVITTKNEEKNIEHCLLSIRQQTYPQDKIEIIVVDNNSLDKTKKIARKFTGKIFDKSPERSAQRNYGIAKAKGEYILYLDADMMLSPGVIEECVEKSENSKIRKFEGTKFKTFQPSNLKTFKHSNLVGLYIPEVILGDSYWCKVRNFERSFYNATVIDAVRFFPKKVWQEVGGFDENLTGPEDWDFDKKLRLKGKVDIIRSPLYHNEQDFNLKEYLKSKSYYVKGIEKYIKKWGNKDVDLKKQLGWYYRYLVVFVGKGKWRKLTQHPFLTLGMIILRLLVGWKYLQNEK